MAGLESQLLACMGTAGMRKGHMTYQEISIAYAICNPKVSIPAQGHHAWVLRPCCATNGILNRLDAMLTAVGQAAQTIHHQLVESYEYE